MASIDTLAVIGAGQMGRGIAQVAASAGLQVRLLDASAELAAAGKERIGRDLAKLVEKGKLSGDARDAVLAKIEPTDDYARLSDVDFVVEAVSENTELKLQIFRKADVALPEHAVLASNTSSISLTKLAGAVQRPSRVIGMHFMNPVPVMKLVELVRALQTSEDTFATTRALAERLGKTVVVSRDAPGFLVNRMLIPLLNEACFELQEGLATAEDIDTSAKLGLNHPMGPLELADLIGLDTVLSIAEVLHRELGDDKYRPATILRNYVAAGWLGRKTGKGFYDYAR
jgi:3-hydroxybutyryl-CoA dehydrogenase